MKILIIGNGGREHALLWRMAADRPETKFLITRGTPGTEDLAESIDVSPTDILTLVDAALAHEVDLTVVGPEAPLAEGLVDRLHERGLAAFGPTAAAARIETSKAFAKNLMRQAGVPTAGFEIFTGLQQALDYVSAGPEGCVVKADGLAAGKGSVVCRSREEASRALHLMMHDRAFGAAGETVVVEELMAGEELSVLALVDGQNILTLVPSQDHKAVGEGDTGPNTGGMGAYAPVGVATQKLIAQVSSEIMEPVVAALKEAGCPYRGCLYAGLMLTAGGPQVVEFNCRFGDPESQVVLPLLDGDLVSLLEAVSAGSLAGMQAGTLPDKAAVCVVLASGGYPGDYAKGKPVRFGPGLSGRQDLVVFHAGTVRGDGQVVTAGGRVLGVTGLGGNVELAAAAAYSGIEEISFEGKYFRRDIGYREIERIRRQR
ncbi:MAG: phosphoribosylamine--glycine ligase [Candidatus Glassbacteria bacterium]|nr:phosphoribosylamine--glycine ligase [Candidatus Glassbacteria bacterium]